MDDFILCWSPLLIETSGWSGTYINKTFVAFQGSKVNRIKQGTARNRKQNIFSSLIAFI